MEISNVEETEDSRRAMIKLKVKYSVGSYSSLSVKQRLFSYLFFFQRGIREIAKVPHVLLEISVSGVRVLDAITKVFDHLWIYQLAPLRHKAGKLVQNNISTLCVLL